MINYHLLPQFRPARLQDLVLWYEPWSFRGRTWRNLAPNFSDRNHGTAYGGVGLSTWHPQFSPAPTFYGDEYVEVPDDDSLDITDAITIEAWMKLDSSWSNYGHICTKRDGDNTAWQFYVRIDRRLGANGGATSNDVSGATQIPTEQWTHVAVVITSNTFNLYVNGNIDVTKTATALATNSVPVSIGARFDGYPSIAYPFNGIIPLIHIYKAALTPVEIMHNYTHHPLYYLRRGISPYMFVKRGGIYVV